MFDLPPPDPSIEIVVASRGYSKGLAQTDGVQFLGRGEVAFGGLYFGAQWKNITSSVAEGEAQTYVGYQTTAGSLELDVSAGFHLQTGLSAPTDDKRAEFNLTIARPIGPVTPRISATFTFDDFGGTRESLYVEGGASYRVASGTTLSANMGFRERSGNDDYTTFNLGISQRIVRQVSVELRYYDTAQSSRGDNYESRGVASLRLRF